MKKTQPYFIFDVESIGLHGEAFAVAGGVYIAGAAQWEFVFACPTEEATGTPEDRRWIKENVPQLEATHRIPKTMRQSFWEKLKIARERYSDILMAVECGWPVEAKFLEECISDDKEARKWSGPYPLHEIASFMFAAGMDPMASYKRTFSESPAHSPLADVRLSSRLLSEAIEKLSR